jgi:hypothetical protein
MHQVPAQVVALLELLWLRERCDGGRLDGVIMQIERIKYHHLAERL